MAVQMIPPSAYMAYLPGTAYETRFPVTWPVATFYARYPDRVLPLFDMGIQIGGDNSIILDGDVVMNRKNGKIGEIDYFHGYHSMKFTLEGETVERTVHMPVAQMLDHDETNPDDADWLANEMILVMITSKAGGGNRYRYAGPLYKAVLTLQRKWRMKRGRN